MTDTITIEEIHAALKRRGGCACGSAREWLSTQPDAETAWRTCARGDWLIWVLRRMPAAAGPLRTIAYRAADRACRLHAPAALDAAGLAASAARLRALAPVIDRASATAARAAAALGAAERAALGAAWAAERAAEAEDVRDLVPWADVRAWIEGVRQ